MRKLKRICVMLKDELLQEIEELILEANDSDNTKEEKFN